MRLKWNIYDGVHWEVWTDDHYDTLGDATTPAWVWRFWRKINEALGWSE